jgi:cytochrome b561
VLRYGAVAMLLHWGVALLVFAQIWLGWWMLDLPDKAQAYWFNLHKSIGLTIALLVLARFAWRLRHPPPALPASIPRWRVRAARINHSMLYAALLAQPLAGYLGSSFSGYPIRYFGLLVPGWGWNAPALKELFSAVHLGLSYLISVLVLLHIAAALKHLLIDRDGVFQRMLPWPPAASARAAAGQAPPAG